VYVSKFKDAEHLVRLAVAFVCVFVLSLLIRAHFVPKSFGEFGHYRGDALAELSSKPIHYAGHQACELCHPDEAGLKKTGKHAGVNCESCHGPLAKHAEDPTSLVPELPNTTVLCPRCHEANIAKPSAAQPAARSQHAQCCRAEVPDVRR
jgi:hypothetical protein